jgi:hypothetical protein
MRLNGYNSLSEGFAEEREKNRYINCPCWSSNPLRLSRSLVSKEAEM